MRRFYYITVFGAICLIHATSCSKSDNNPDTNTDTIPARKDTFYFGADLSYVNQILDHGGLYKDAGTVSSPYKIFKDHGANLVRVRLWHTPTWTKDVYGASGTQLYSDYNDVEKTIRESKQQGLQVLLDFHYSDIWADPGKQEAPDAWKDIKDVAILKDSVYQYTFKTLQLLNSKGLMPEMVQLGNEINCGLFFTNATTGFPFANSCNGDWLKLGELLNSGIRAVRDAAASSSIKPKIILHVADPKNVTWWFDNITSIGKVTDFEVIGFSYYPLWHSTVSLDNISDNVAQFRNKYNKKIMLLETAYPWTLNGNDNYNNSFGSQSPLNGFPFSVQGQFDLMKKLTQEVIDGGGSGIIYWEPAWISSSMKDLWGTGSSWENAALFDFNGEVLPAIDYMEFDYNWK